LYVQLYNMYSVPLYTVHNLHYPVYSKTYPQLF